MNKVEEIKRKYNMIPLRKGAGFKVMSKALDELSTHYECVIKEKEQEITDVMNTLDELSTHYEGVIKEREKEIDKAKGVELSYMNKLEQKDKEIAELKEKVITTKYDARQEKLCNQDLWKENKALRDENEKYKTDIACEVYVPHEELDKATAENEQLRKELEGCKKDFHREIDLAEKRTLEIADLKQQLAQVKPLDRRLLEQFGHKFMEVIEDMRKGFQTQKNIEWLLDDFCKHFGTTQVKPLDEKELSSFILDFNGLVTHTDFHKKLAQVICQRYCTPQIEKEG